MMYDLSKMTGATQGTIDVHAHYTTARYRSEAEAAGHVHPDGFPTLPEWESGVAIDQMDRIGVATAMLSVSSPGVNFGDAAAAGELARHVNDFGAAAVAGHPGRFGLFASLPLPDVDSSLVELERAFEELDADGVVLMTNATGTYLGDPVLEPLFAELNRRAAAVFIHPTSPCGWEHTALGYPRPMIEFAFDTTRAVSNLILRGVRKRHPNMEVIVPHAGGALPVLADRVAGMAEVVPGLSSDVSGAEVTGALRSFWYDLAGFVTPRQLPALLELVEADRLLYGSDWPFTPDPVVEALSRALAGTDALGPEELAAVRRDNALRLFPRLQA